MLKVSEVIKHIEKMYGVKLMDYQKEFVKHVIKGDVIYTPRCFGRSMIYDGYADYLKNVVGKMTDFSVDPSDFDKVYTYQDVPRNTLYNDDFLQNLKNKEYFSKEYECQYEPTDESKELERRLNLEKARSDFWRCRANGETPLVVGSKEDIKYITS